MPRTIALAALGLLLAGAPASADEASAETCVRAKVWDGYAEGWGIRTLTAATLSENGTRNYLVTLYKGNEYKITTCGDEAVVDLDLVLYDLDGEVVLRDQTTDREPVLTYEPQQTGTYYIVLHARDLATEDAGAGVSMAVVYR